MMPAYKQTYFIAAISVGLSWFLLIYGAAFLTNHLSFLIDNPLLVTNQKEPYLEKFSLPILFLGILIYWLILPFIIKHFTQDSYWQIVGMQVKRKKLVTTLLFVIMPFISILPLPYSLSSWQSQYLTNWHYTLANAQNPIVEEVIMRGLFIYLMQKGGFDNKWIIGVGALIFSSYHFLLNGFGGFITGLASIVVMFMPTLMTGNIISAMINHSLLNAGLFVPTFIGTVIVFILNYFVLKKRVSNYWNF